jgi:hypothetical protein
LVVHGRICHRIVLNPYKTDDGMVNVQKLSFYLIKNTIRLHHTHHLDKARRKITVADSNNHKKYMQALYTYYTAFWVVMMLN